MRSLICLETAEKNPTRDGPKLSISIATFSVIFQSDDDDELNDKDDRLDEFVDKDARQEVPPPSCNPLIRARYAAWIEV